MKEMIEGIKAEKVLAEGKIAKILQELHNVTALEIEDIDMETRKYQTFGCEDVSIVDKVNIALKLKL